MTVNHPSEPSLSAVEQQVEEIWRYVLRMPQDQEDATFFELQGQSVSAIRIASRIEDELGIRIDAGSLFENPSMKEFIWSVTEQVKSSAQAGGER
ncbi:phosphopantetheine-binding protein [Nonomuraea jiangxiensis]|uniref:Phosphopantetheine attachment site n=1 Tax=Nonomuraea jiangxiensis TaxID=633440 RepID=A0A1G8IJQ7_9ACTN|nr:phosphopantetheine-binding protein [Nonomuraea jiangxiensis]SDI19072.1 Phosphopantetheine attachment site [Nonomuraea jiangxiensis]